MLLPSLQKAREKALMAVCLSNQKQIGIGFQRYIKDHDNSLPFGEFTNGSGVAPSWEPQVSQYMGIEYPDNYFGTKTYEEYKAANSNKYKGENKSTATVNNPILLCPSDDVIPQRNGFARSYMTNGYENYWKNEYTNKNNPFYNYGLIGTKRGRHIATVDLNPVLIIEGDHTGYEKNKVQGYSWNSVLATSGDFDNLTTPHYKEFFNVLLLDGSASSKVRNSMRVNNYLSFKAIED